MDGIYNYKVKSPDKYYNLSDAGMNRTSQIIRELTSDSPVTDKGTTSSPVADDVSITNSTTWSKHFAIHMDNQSGGISIRLNPLTYTDVRKEFFSVVNYLIEMT